VEATGFRPRQDHELEQLPDDALIAYLRNAAAAGDAAAASRALAILVHGYAQDVERRLALRVPRWAVEDTAHEALVRAIASAYDGSSRGEFRAWLNTIVDRAAADWFRRRERQPQEVALPDGSAQDVWGAEPSTGGESGAVELRIVVEQVMTELNESHRRVIELHVFDGLTAPEVSQLSAGMTADNVAQIASRFRKRVRQEIETADTWVRP
jgi:RNA polymerase sigma factor (sigma-70 family)